MYYKKGDYIQAVDWFKKSLAGYSARLVGVTVVITHLDEGLQFSVDALGAGAGSQHRALP